MIKKVRICNFRSIIDTTIEFNDLVYVLAGQNEAGKSSILEAMHSFEEEIIDRENLNFEEESKGNVKQTISITYETNESFFNLLEQKCIDLVDEERRKSTTLTSFFDKNKLKNLKEFTLTKSINFDDVKVEEFKLDVNQNAFDIIKSAIIGLPKYNEDTFTTIAKTILPIIDIAKQKSELILNIWRASPQIVFFDNIADLLPDEIYIDELIKNDSGQKGIKAVKNFEEIIGIDFVSLSKKTPVLKKGNVERYNNSITATFQKDWKQKIAGENQVEISFDLSFDESGKEKISFYIKSKDGVYLQPRRRSKGLIWFLSLWLELKASEKYNNTLFLFDEPGQNLHVKACYDMLEVFNNLSKSSHQIIYSTHSPSLIELEKLHNIGLVLNTEKEGTIVEGLTTSKIDTSFKRDALQPISEAMGLEPLKEFSILAKKNVIVEGLSDFWYYKGMSKILNRKNDYKFVPGIGVKSSKLYPLLSFCIGYGLEWVLIMENGENPQKVKKDLLESNFFNDEEEINNKVKIINFKEIEDMFTLSDFNLLDSKINKNVKKNPSEIIGKRKIIFSRNFFAAVEKGVLTKEKLDPSTINNFEKVFDFIDDKLFNSK